MGQDRWPHVALCGPVWLCVALRGWNLAPGMTLLAYLGDTWGRVLGLDADRDGGHSPGCGRPLSLFLFPAAESGHHVDAAASVAGGAGRYREDREAGVPEGVAGDAGP